eukprot:COSAG02_NODE_360_length_23829_cov_107.112769_10_plen_41_part_00
MEPLGSYQKYLPYLAVAREAAGRGGDTRWGKRALRSLTNS